VRTVRQAAVDIPNGSGYAGGRAHRFREKAAMSGSSTNILAGRKDQTICLRIMGRVTAEFCPALKAYCTSEGNAPPTDVLVQLQQCEYFDSTFLGTLLCLRGKFGEGHVVLVAPGPECLAALKRMGAHLLFPIRDEPPIDDLAWTSLSDHAAARESLAFQHNVLEAHVELARTAGPLQQIYEPIARQVEREFAERHGSGAQPSDE
jgi:anti-anti-sigma regulatory factor